MILQKINKLDFNKKEVVKTLLNIITKDNNDNFCYMEYGFFDNTKDYKKFLNNIDLYNIANMYNNEFNSEIYDYLGVKPVKLTGNGVSELVNNCFWFKCCDELVILRFKDLKTFIEVDNKNSYGTYKELFNLYEGTINNLLKYSLSY